jgi:uncharacterized protein DUF6069
MGEPSEYPYRLSPPPATGGSDHRPAVNATRLWADGLAAAVVAALTGLVGDLVVLALLRAVRLELNAAGAFGYASTVRLCVVAAAAALAGTGLVHLLLLSTPRPLVYFGWIAGLVTAAAVVSPFLAGGPGLVMLARATINLVIGLAIASLISGAAISATDRFARSR